MHDALSSIMIWHPRQLNISYFLFRHVGLTLHATGGCDTSAATRAVSVYVYPDAFGRIVSRSAQSSGFALGFGQFFGA